MKERPILFSAPMVQALLAGNKTQTRRVIKFPIDNWEIELRENLGPIVGWITSKHRLMNRFGLFIQRETKPEFLEKSLIPCPYREPGDQLWVRETFSASYKTEEHCRKYGEINYRADCDEFREEMLSLSWTPSIHMPRWASRIQLEITNIRVERLQAISEEDAIAEGVIRWSVGLDKQPESGWWHDYSYTDEEAQAGYPPLLSAKESYKTLWESINGADSWNSNPWVWVIEFKRVERQQ